jgi:hypothetical protein
MRKRILFCLMLISPIFSSAILAQSTERRVALIVGNDRYVENIGALKNAVSDASLISDTLTKVGFEVTLLTDSNHRDMIKAIKHFGMQLRDSDVGLFYYSGHAVQYQGGNYLIPIDATEIDPTDIEFETIDLQRIVSMMEYADNRMNVLIMDACRNNPFRSLSRSVENSGGLAFPKTTGDGLLISYSTAPGRVAADGAGVNSPFSSALARNIVIPNTKIEEVFKEVRREVLEVTNGEQIPWENSSIVGDFYFSSTVNATDNVEISSAIEPDTKNLLPANPEQSIKTTEVVDNQPVLTKVRSAVNPCDWADYKWRDLNVHERALFVDLGWNEDTWDSPSESDDPESEIKSWSEISQAERHAAEELGYTNSLWDNYTESCE